MLRQGMGAHAARLRTEAQAAASAQRQREDERDARLARIEGLLNRLLEALLEENQAAPGATTTLDGEAGGLERDETKEL